MLLKKIRELTSPKRLSKKHNCSYQMAKDIISGRGGKGYRAISEKRDKEFINELQEYIQQNLTK